MSLVEREFRNSPDFPGAWQDAGACVAGGFGVAEPWVQKVASRLRHTRAPWTDAREATRGAKGRALCGLPELITMYVQRRCLGGSIAGERRSSLARPELR
jgi:hypothetical protein